MLYALCLVDTHYPKLKLHFEMNLWQKRSLIGQYGLEIFRNSEDDTYNDNAPPWKSLIQDLSDFYLDSLCAIFKEQVYTKNVNKRNEGTGLHKEEFVNAVNEVFGHDNHSLQAIQLFNDIDKHRKNKISWNDFLDFLGNPNEIVLAPKVKLCSPKIFSVPHAEREAITKIVLIETEKHFCYAIVSKYGRVGLYDGNLNFLTSYQAIFAREDVQRTDEERRRRNRWITDAIFLADIFMFALVTSTCSLTIYDASGLRHVPLWLILGAPYVITSIAYTGVTSKGATLYLGDETGSITSLNFVQPKTSLFRKKYNEKLNSYYWRELPAEKNHVIIKRKTNVYKEPVNVTEYFTENATLVTCSRDKKVSTIIKPSDPKLKPVIFKIRRGVCTFAYSKYLNVIVTGCDDGFVQLWNYIMPKKALATLQGHDAGITDLAIIETFRYLLSCSRDAVFILWDMVSHKKLQYIKLKYPPFEILGRAIEWGKRCIFPGPKRQSLTDDQRPKSVKVSFGEQLEVNKSIIEEPKENLEAEEAICKPSNVWERSYILVTCRSFIAQIDLSLFDINIAETLEPPVLLPPPLQNSVLVPNSWNLSLKDDIPQIEEIEVDEKVQNHIDSLGFILNRDFLKEPGAKNNINIRIAKLESNKLKMNNVVAQCAPFLALDLPVVEEVRITPNLTAPTDRKVRSIVEKTNRILSSAASRSQILSESTSRSRSSKSSIVEFNA